MTVSTTRRRRLVAPHRLALVAAVFLWACGGDSTGPNSGGYTPPPPVDGIAVSDLQNFWAAYDAGGKNGSSSTFQTLYLDRATTGLRDFIKARNVTAGSVAQMVTASPQYFAALRASHQSMIADGSPVLATIRRNRDTMKAKYAASVAPTITLLVGRFSTAGTTSANGMLIGTEFYGASASVPRSELQQFQRDNVHGADSLPFVVAHEHVHILQARVSGGLMGHSGKTLLEQSILEGTADFVGEMVSGGFINAFIHPWALAHEAALWSEFKAAMNGTDVSQWLYNQGSASGGRPGDLGYFMGYRMAQSYYQRATDKTAALKDIIEVTNAQAFLTASGYNPGR